MNLSACPECNQQISSKAKVCPHCGADVKKIASRQKDVETLGGAIVTGIRTGSVFAVWFWFCFKVLHRLGWL
jgi:hypothetical protein